ncbi:MAG: cobalamin biosynthesis protein CbiD [Spirochaetales bacterium]|nr:cobalamin biosynthesis protein CbiD [Spirochaetales bacterium]
MAQWYYEVIGKVNGLRRGLTTGSCAQAAAKAALLCLLTGVTQNTVTITLPKSREFYSQKTIKLAVEHCDINTNEALAWIKKDAGDDNDITANLLIGARVILMKNPEKTIILKGGQGLGHFTLDNALGKKGEPAINPVPRKMINQELFPLLPENTACEVTLIVPKGEETATQTWNPRIGIKGGISIIGTRGVVEPRSQQAYKVAINRVIKDYQKRGMIDFVITPGFVGEKFLKNIGYDLDKVVTVGDHIGHSLNQISQRKGQSILLIGHISKMSKVAAGIFNTHYSRGDARLEVIAAWAGAAGAPPWLIQKLLSLKLAEDTLPLLKKHGLENTYSLIAAQVVRRMNLYIKEKYTLGCILLSLAGNPVGYFPDNHQIKKFIKGNLDAAL